MKLTVLIDNNTLIDRYFLGELGVSYLIEEGSKQILFDVGYSDAFISNAQKQNLNLLQSDFIILSHGHLDHTWGLGELLKKHMEADKEHIKTKSPTMIIHERTLYDRPRSYVGGSGSLINESRISQFFNIEKISEPYWITDNLVCLCNIPRINDFECQKPFLKIRIDNEDVDDYVDDEIALAYKAKDGLVVISACSHAGICNTIEYAKEVCNEQKIIDVIGGFHLMRPSQNQLKNTLEYFQKLQATKVHACHCVDLDSKIALSKVANLKEVGVGLSLKYE